MSIMSTAKKAVKSVALTHADLKTKKDLSKWILKTFSLRKVAIDNKISPEGGSIYISKSPFCLPAKLLYHYYIAKKFYLNLSYILYT